MRKILFVVLISSIFISSCGKKEEQNTTGEKKQESTTSGTNDLSSKGKALFYEASNLTGLKCADCHSDGTNADQLNTKYFSDVIQASKRQSVFAGTIAGEDVKKKNLSPLFCHDPCGLTCGITGPANLEKNRHTTEHWSNPLILTNKWMQSSI